MFLHILNNSSILVSSYSVVTSYLSMTVLHGSCQSHLPAHKLVTIYSIDSIVTSYLFHGSPPTNAPALSIELIKYLSLVYIDESTHFRV